MRRPMLRVTLFISHARWPLKRSEKNINPTANIISSHARWPDVRKERICSSKLIKFPFLGRYDVITLFCSLTP